MTSITQNSTLKNPEVCVLLLKNLRYSGVFKNQNPLDYVIPTLMLQVILSVSISRIIHLLLTPLKQSKLVCSILAGVILGPSVLGRNKTYMEKMFAEKEMVVLSTMSNMAVYLYIFVICIKADGTMLNRAAKTYWKLSLCLIVLPIVFTTSLTIWQQKWLSGISPGGSFPIQLSFVLSLSYFIVITRAMDELNLLTSELGQLSSSITALYEVVAGIFLIIAVTSGQKETKHSIYVVFCLCSLVMFAIFVIRPILFWIIKTTPKGKPVKECHVVGIILSTFLMGVFTDAIGAYFVTASMIMGFIIPDGPPLGATIIRKCQLILFELLLPLFFVRIGYYTDLSAIKNCREFVIFGGLFVAGYLGRLVACLLVSPYMNMKRSNAIFLSLILSLHGVIELVHAIRWRNEQLIDEQTFASIVVFIAVLNVIITPIIAILYKPVVEHFDVSTPVTLHHMSLGTTSINRELRIITCIQEEDNVPSIISLIEAINPKEDVSSICAYVVHLVAACNQTVPTLAPYKNHLRKFSQPSSSDNIIRAFLNYAGKSQAPVQIQPFRMISSYKYMHRYICDLSDTTHTPLIIAPFFKTGETHDADGTLRIFNSNIQATAKYCTVGLLVDRGLRSPISETTFSYNMAVVFFGGADDREALALASRASRQPHVRITVLKIDVISEIHNISLEARARARIEREVDNNLYRDFKAMNVNNGSVVCDEIVAHGIDDIMKAIGSLSKDYDLVVVGKRHRIRELQALENWVQYPELGEIGDAIAAPDFMKAMMSVLVLKHCTDENQRVQENKNT